MINYPQKYKMKTNYPNVFLLKDSSIKNNSLLYDLYSQTYPIWTLTYGLSKLTTAVYQKNNRFPVFQSIDDTNLLLKLKLPDTETVTRSCNGRNTYV